MDQHPVPQNVTTFQFKLIGDITLKQFAYLAGGLLAGYLCTKITLIPSLLRWPFGVVFALLGIGLAFVPIEERPLDRWLAAFFKSIYSPTQFVWRKNNAPYDIMLSSTSSQSAPQTQAPTTNAASTPPLPIKPNEQPVTPQNKAVPEVKDETTSTSPPKINQTAPPPISTPTAPPPFQKMTSAPTSLNFNPPPTKQGAPPMRPLPIPTKETPPPLTPPFIQPVTPPKPPTAPSPIPAQPIDPMPQHAPSTVFSANPPPTPLPHPLEDTVAKLMTKIADLEKKLAENQPNSNQILELQQRLASVTNEKNLLGKKLAEQAQPIAKPAPITPPPTPAVATPPPQAILTQPQSTTKTAVPRVPPKTISALTHQPNVITGIIRDTQNNLLPNLIITVKDKEGLPVRALKTNRLGQFAASTPLPNGKYTLEIEDPKKTFVFPATEVTLTNIVIPTIDISAQDQKDMLRQKLTREIFGPNRI